MNIAIGGNMDKVAKIKFIDSEDAQDWETGKYGQSEEHARRISSKAERKIDGILGLTPVTMRLQKDLVKQLKQIAKKEGLRYQTLIRQILTNHVKSLV
jgi:predicted DNA binding CopG/RHH family protein